MNQKLYYFFIFTILSLCTNNVYSSHIVGGDLQMTYSGRGYIYNIQMNMYFDDLNADPGLLDVDLTITLGIFNKSTDQFVNSINLSRQSADFIDYSNNDCTDPSLVKTRHLVYTGTVDLSTYANPSGYYLIWERCCRNYVIENIYHKVGQVFYLEFSPTTKNGERFYDSTPIFKTVPSQFLCKNEFHILDFGATDPNGDQLVYKMVTPIKGNTTETDVIAYTNAAPYDSVQWLPGYDRQNQIKGTPSLSIDANTGILNVTPSETGLYVFGIVCEAYRNGIKVSESRRDFQYLVVDCPENKSPIIEFGNNSKVIKENDTISFKINQDTCIVLSLTDSSTLFNNQTEQISLSVLSTNLPTGSYILDNTNFIISPTNPRAESNLCFQPCDKVLIEKESVYYYDLLLEDNRCPKKYDTISFYVKVEIPKNFPPIINNELAPTNQITTYPDSTINIGIWGVDYDAYDIDNIEMTGTGFRPDRIGMTFNNSFTSSDSLMYFLNWTPTCKDLEDKESYPLIFTLKDKSCIPSHNITTEIVINLENPSTGLEDIIPFNFITPNNDGINECFEYIDLPRDNCTTKFNYVEIYNHWGGLVYRSTERNYQWCAKNVNDGIYFYHIDLNDTYRKGWIQVIK